MPSNDNPVDSPCDHQDIKILLRGDTMGALNCLLPELNFVPKDSNSKIPSLQQNFSFFSDSTEYLEKVFSSAKHFRNICSTNCNLNPLKTQNDLSEHCIPNNNRTLSDPNQANDCATEVLESSFQSLNDCKLTLKKPKKNRKGRKNRTPIMEMPPDKVTETTFNRSFINDSNPSTPQNNHVKFDYEPIISDIEQQYINYVINLLEENYDNKFLTPQKLNGNKFIKPKVARIAPFNINLPILNISKCPKMNRNQEKSKLESSSSLSLSKSMPRKIDFKKSKKHTKHLQHKKVSKKVEKVQKKEWSLGGSLTNDDNWNKYELKSSPKFEMLPPYFTNFIALKGKFSQNLNWQNLRVAQELLPRSTKSETNKGAFVEQLDCSQKSNMFSINMQNLLTACEATKNSDIYNFNKNELASLATNNTSDVHQVESFSDLEKEALEQYRSSDDSLEEKFKKLEKEAEEQYIS